MSSANLNPRRRSFVATVVLGVVIPQLALIAVLGLVLVSGSGKAEAPSIVFFSSLFAVPALALLGTWVLFVSWSTTTRLLSAASILPLIFVAGSVLFIHGTGAWQKAGLVVLAFMNIPMRRIEELFLGWGVAMVLAVLGAWWHSRRAQPHRG